MNPDAFPSTQPREHAPKENFIDRIKSGLGAARGGVFNIKLESNSTEFAEACRENKITIDTINSYITERAMPITGKLADKSYEQDTSGIAERIGRLPEDYRQLIAEKIKKGSAGFIFKESDTGEVSDALLANVVLSRQYGFKKRRGEELFLISSLLSGKRLGSDNLEGELKERLEGKKILILGDDVGSLSEVLNKCGAEAVGLEYKPESIMVARSGLLSEDGDPQNQVIQGNISDLAEGDSELFQKIQSMGPFDLIFSESVFNGGSGIMNAYNAFAKKHKISLGHATAFYRALFRQTDAILSENGISLHLGIDEFGGFDGDLAGKGLSKIRNDIQGNVERAEELRNAFTEYGGLFFTIPLPDERRDSFIIKKGLVEKLAKMYPEINN